MNIWKSPEPLPMTPRKTVLCIKKWVCQHFDLTLEDLKKRDKRSHVTRPRIMAMALSQQLTKLSCYEIGALFERNRGAVVNAVKRHQDWCDTDKRYRAESEKVTMLVKREMGELSWEP